MKVKILVAEPWNFEDPDGQNVMKGVIVKNLSKTAVLFKSNHVQKFEQGEGSLKYIRADLL